MRGADTDHGFADTDHGFASCHGFASPGPFAVLAVALLAFFPASWPGTLQASPRGREAEPTAQTQAHKDAKHRYAVNLDESWRQLAVPTESLAPLAGFEHPASQALLAINRVGYPNLEAWRKRTMPAYKEEIEEGIRATVRGYRPLHSRVHKLGNVPALDLSFRHHTDGRAEVVLVRFLFFRSYSLSLILSTPARTHRTHLRRHRGVLESFQPYFGA